MSVKNLSGVSCEPIETMDLRGPKRKGCVHPHRKFVELDFRMRGGCFGCHQPRVVIGIEKVVAKEVLRPEMWGQAHTSKCFCQYVRWAMWKSRRDREGIVHKVWEQGAAHTEGGSEDQPGYWAWGQRRGLILSAPGGPWMRIRAEHGHSKAVDGQTWKWSFRV